jgi:hypothetical protein
MATKPEFRIAKPERSPKHQRTADHSPEVFFRISSFGFPSDFGFRISAFHRQFDGKPASAPNFALHDNPPAVRFDNVFHDA